MLSPDGLGLLPLRDRSPDPITEVSAPVTVPSDIELAGVILFGGSVGVAGVGASEVLRRGFGAPLESNAEDGINTGIAS